MPILCCSLHVHYKIAAKSSFFPCAALCWNPSLLLVWICHNRDRNRRKMWKARLTPTLKHNRIKIFPDSTINAYPSCLRIQIFRDSEQRNYKSPDTCGRSLSKMRFLVSLFPCTLCDKISGSQPHSTETSRSSPNRWTCFVFGSEAVRCLRKKNFCRCWFSLVAESDIFWMLIIMLNRWSWTDFVVDFLWSLKLDGFCCWFSLVVEVGRILLLM